MRAIYPLILGERKRDGSVGDLFSERHVNALPDTIPTRSIETANALLRNNGNTSSTMGTVREIVQKLTKYNGLRCCEPNYVGTATDRIGIILARIIESMETSEKGRILQRSI